MSARGGRRARKLIARCAVGASLAVLGAGHVSGSWAESAGMFSSAQFESTSGAEIYGHICQGCHMPNGQGAVGAGRYPALAKDPALLSTRYMAITLLEGRRNMPAYGGDGDTGQFFKTPTLNDEQIAAVINYVRSNFGNHYSGSITAAEVKALRRPR